MSKNVYKTSFFIRYNPHLKSVLNIGLNTECYSFAELKIIVDDFYNHIVKNPTALNFEWTKKVKKTTLSLTKQEDQSLEILLIVYDTSAIAYFQKSLMEFINNRYFVKRRMELERKILISNLENVNEALQKNEDRKKADNANQLLFNIDKDIMDLKICRNELENKINNLQGYETTVGPILPESPYGMPSFISYPLFSLSGLLLGVFLSFLFEKELHL